ncbi:MAG: tetratricopeptide repeat protein [Chloroflexaceae bacterium]|nr:tetratricopeptide repeat protein [Chloroflexaceae bacterium]
MERSETVFNQQQQQVATQYNVGGAMHVYPPLLPPPIIPSAPLPVEDFVGRQEELMKLAAVLRQADGLSTRHRRGTLCLIRGMPGVGKTQLVLKLIEHVAEQFPDGQIMVDLRGTSKRPLRPAQVLHSIIRAFLPTYPYTDDLYHEQRLLHHLLLHKRVLVFADDAHNEDQISDLIVPIGSAVLITSRFNLKSGRRQTVLKLEKLPAPDAEQLVLDICSRIELSAAAELAKQCDYLPLALRISAGYLASHETRQVQAYLQDLMTQRIELLQQAPFTKGDPSYRNASVAASIALSYAALTPAIQQAFRQFAVFVSDFDENAAQAVLSDTEPTADALLAELEHCSLLEYGKEQQRYTMPALVRDFARAELRHTDQERATRSRYAQYYADLCRTLQREAEQGVAGLTAALRRFDQERPHIGEGWRWAREHTPPTDETDTIQLDYGLATMTLGSLRYHPRNERMEQYAAMLAAAHRQKRPNRVAIAMHNLGAAHAALGEYRTAIRYYEQNLALCRTINNRVGEGIALGHLGEMYTELGDYQRALQYHRKNLQLARAIENNKGVSIALGNLGYALSLSGAPQKALPLHRQQLELVRERGDWYGEAVALSRLSVALILIGEAAQAQQHLMRAQQLAREIGARPVEGRIADRLGQAALQAGNWVAARKHFDTSIQIARELGDRGAEGRTLWRVAEVLLKLGNREAALAALRQAVQIAEAVQHTEAATYAAHLAQHTASEAG